MSILGVLSLIFFGLIVGLIAKAIHPGDEPVGFLPTVSIGIVGSFVGGVLNWALGYKDQIASTSGFAMSIVGGVLFCALWRYYKLKNSSEGPKSFVTGRKIR
jgi:uncharacterized membrane protein YeaQ/YmgE (transglycosylase-associated protein family)